MLSKYEAILKFDPVKDAFDDFARLVADYWDCSYGLLEYNKDKQVLKLATGGWSDNESVIDAIEQNRMIMMCWWAMSQRGGAYWFAPGVVDVLENNPAPPPGGCGKPGHVTASDDEGTCYCQTCEMEAFKAEIARLKGKGDTSCDK